MNRNCLLYLQQGKLSHFIVTYDIDIRLLFLTYIKYFSTTSIPLPYFLVISRWYLIDRLFYHADDQTRVVLRRRNGGGYINANYVRAVRLTDSKSSVQSSIESLNSVQCKHDVFLPLSRYFLGPISHNTLYYYIFLFSYEFNKNWVWCETGIIFSRRHLFAELSYNLDMRWKLRQVCVTIGVYRG